MICYVHKELCLPRKEAFPVQFLLTKNAKETQSDKISFTLKIVKGGSRLCVLWGYTVVLTSTYHLTLDPPLANHREKEGKRVDNGNSETELYFC